MRYFCQQDCDWLLLFVAKKNLNVFVASLLVKFGQNSEIKSLESGCCWSWHVWQHQLWDAAQSCLNRCILSGVDCLQEQVGVSKKSILTVYSPLFSPALLICTTSPSLTISHTHTQCQCLWGTVGSMPFSSCWPLNQDIPCYTGSGEGGGEAAGYCLSLSSPLSPSWRGNIIRGPAEAVQSPASRTGLRLAVSFEV